MEKNWIRFSGYQLKQLFYIDIQELSCLGFFNNHVTTLCFEVTYNLIKCCLKVKMYVASYFYMCFYSWENV